MRYWTVLVAAILFLEACSPRDQAGTHVTTYPRLVSTAKYGDGGTLCFVVVDARGETLRGGIDNRMTDDDSICPLHCFVGGNYPTDPGVRLLPLWGDEERELIGLLTAVVNGMATPAELQVLVEARSGAEVPSKFHGGLWGFIGSVEGRRRTLEAIDRGLLVGTIGPGRLFDGADTSHVESLIRSTNPERFVLTFPSEHGYGVRIGFPTSPDSAMSPALIAGRSSESWYLAGSLNDRIMVSYVMQVLARDSALVDSSDRSDLLKVLELRRAKILEADKGC